MINSGVLKKNDSGPSDTLIKDGCSRELNKIGRESSGEEEENQSKYMHMSQKELWPTAYKADWNKTYEKLCLG